VCIDVEALEYDLIKGKAALPEDYL